MAADSPSPAQRARRGRPSPSWCWGRRPALLVQLAIFCLILLVSLASSAGATPSPQCPVRFKGRVKPPTVKPGKRLRVGIKLANDRGWNRATLANGTLELRLPLFTTYQAAIAKAKTPGLARVGGSGGGSGGGKRAALPAYDPNARTLTWTGLALKPKGAITFTAIIQLEACYPGPILDFPFAASFQGTQGAPAACALEGVARVGVHQAKENGWHSGGPRVPGCGPTPAPTLRPTPAPTRSCGLGEYRPPVGGPCQFCAPGTFWNQTYETSACLDCPTAQTSLQGAARCYTPCPPNSALNTTDLSCTAIPPSVFEAAAQLNFTVDANSTQVFVVQEAAKLEDTIGAAAAKTNETVVIVVAPGVYPQVNAYVLSTNVVILADPSLAQQQQDGRRRRLLLHGRGLQTVLVDAIIDAITNERHIIMKNASIWTDGVILKGAATGLYSGGIELQAGALGLFTNTTFLSCRTAGNGGGLQLTGGSSATVGAGSRFVDNRAVQGGAIHIAGGCSVRINNTVAFTGNAAPRTSPTAGGGGAIYVAGGASLQLNNAVTFADNVDDDVTVAGGVVSCADPLFTNCTAGCTGSYALPASCPICSAGGGGGTCSTCPKGSFGGAGVALVCELCPLGFTTVYPPSSTSSSACVPITQSPTLAPTATGDTRSPTLTPTISPSAQPTQQPTAPPTASPSAQPTQQPTTSPSAQPTASPSAQPTQQPTARPTLQPTTAQPTASPTRAGYKAPVVARYYHDSCITAPTPPSPPSFTGGTLRTVGTGGTYATLSDAIAAASAGDRIQVLAGIIVETTAVGNAAAVTVDKSLEIFGTGRNCVVKREPPSNWTVISISAGVNNVYIHDLAVVNNQLASSDSSGKQSSCITAGTMTEANPNGSTGIYIANCTFIYPKFGVSIDAASWVVRDCTFTPNSNTPGAEIRALGAYGSTGQSFAIGNTFNNPTTAGFLSAIFIDSVGPRGASFTTGYNGSLTLANNVISTSGGAPRAYIYCENGMYRQPGPSSSTGSNGNFSMYLQGNDFRVNYSTSAPVLFVGKSGVPGFGFFDVLLAKDNVFGARVSGNQKGALFFTKGSASTLDSFAGGFYAGGNTFSTPGVVIGAAYAQASFTPNLLVVENYPAPAPLITPIYPAGTAGLLTVDGVQLAAGDRVFAVDTCDAKLSGLYTAAAGAWARTADFAVGMNVSGAFFEVASGTQWGSTDWTCTNGPGAAIVGTNALTFAQTP